jgi:hypothetical protein
VDDGHKIRLKLLAKQMISAVEIPDAVQARAFELYIANHPAKGWVKEFQANRMPLVKETITHQNLKAATQRQPSGASGNRDDDLIDMKTRL